MRFVYGLPADLPAAILIVVHIQPHAKSILPDLLTRAGPLPAAHAVDGEPIKPGRIYVAPPDRHLLVEAGVVRLSSGPRENHARPAVDPLFRSAALAYGRRVVGVVLSGALSDGTAGLWDVKQRGGIAVVQDPGDAVYPSMPHSAMDQVPVDHVLPLAEIPGVLVELVGKPGRHEELSKGTSREGAGSTMAAIGSAPIEEKPGTDSVERDMAAQVAGERDGQTTVYTCPDCGGTLWQVNAGRFLRFRCHVGHVYSDEDLLEGYTDAMERTLWRAVRSLRDKANLTRQLAQCASERPGQEETAARYEETARKDEEYAATIREMIGAATSTNRGGS